MEEEVESCKVVLLGEAGVGKTSIISQFIENEFNETQESTPGATFSKKVLTFQKYNNKVLSLEVWDTAGQEKYRALAKMFYKDAAIAVLVYDVTRKSSFEQLKSYWVNQLLENAPKKILLALVGNKSDLVDLEEVDEEEARQLAKTINASFRTTSAKTMEGIEELFLEVGNRYLNPEEEYSEEAIIEDKNLQDIKRESVRVSRETHTHHSKKRKKKWC